MATGTESIGATIAIGSVLGDVVDVVDCCVETRCTRSSRKIRFDGKILFLYCFPVHKKTRRGKLLGKEVWVVFCCDCEQGSGGVRVL